MQPILISAIIAAIVTGGFTVLAVALTNGSHTRRLNIQLEADRRQEERSFLREKIEELFLLTRIWYKNIGAYHMDISGVMRGAWDYDKANQMLIERHSKKNGEENLDRIEMIVMMYFPQIQPEHESLMKVRSEINAIEAEFRNEYRNGRTDGSPYIKSFYGKMDLLHKADSKLVDKIKEVSKYI